VQEAERLAAAGRLDSALTHLRALRDAHADDVSLHLAYMKLMLLGNRRDDLQEDYHKRQLAEPRSAQAAFLYAMVAPDSLREQLLDQALRLDARYPWAHLARGILVASESTSPASEQILADFRAAVEARPSLAEAWMQLAFAYMSRQDTTHAMASIHNALAADSEQVILIAQGRAGNVGPMSLAPAVGTILELHLPPPLNLPLPPFTLRDTTDAVVGLDSFRGKVVVLDFWATWCGPCRRTMPLISQFARQSDSTRVVVISAQIFERRPDAHELAAKMFREQGYAMHLMRADDSLGELFGFNSIPTMFVIGPDGRIGFRNVGFVPYLVEELQWQVTSLLKQDHPR
jgi:thiol-disulfide isomerase/thioredoxin